MENLVLCTKDAFPNRQYFTVKTGGKIMCMQYASVCDIIQLKKAMTMARTANVFARVEPELKEQAESIDNYLVFYLPDN